MSPGEACGTQVPPLSAGSRVQSVGVADDSVSPAASLGTGMRNTGLKRAQTAWSRLGWLEWGPITPMEPHVGGDVHVRTACVCLPGCEGGFWGKQHFFLPRGQARSGITGPWNRTGKS